MAVQGNPFGDGFAMSCHVTIVASLQQGVCVCV